MVVEGGERGHAVTVTIFSCKVDALHNDGGLQTKREMLPVGDLFQRFRLPVAVSDGCVCIAILCFPQLIV